MSTTITTTMTMTSPTSTPDPGEDYVGDYITVPTRIVFIVIGIIYSVVGVLGNIVLIVTIFITKSMRNPHYYYIVNLAVADMLITGFVIPQLVVSLILHVYPVVNFQHCVFNGTATVVAFGASLLTLMAISINRYLSVCRHPLFERIYARGVLTSFAGCFSIWLVAFLATVPCLVGWGRFTFDEKTHYCGYDRTYSFSYTLTLMLFSIGTPVCVIFVCNFAIWRYVRVVSHRIYMETHKHTMENHEAHPSTSGAPAKADHGGWHRKNKIAPEQPVINAGDPTNNALPELNEEGKQIGDVDGNFRNSQTQNTGDNESKDASGVAEPGKGETTGQTRPVVKNGLTLIKCKHERRHFRKVGSNLLHWMETKHIFRHHHHDNHEQTPKDADVLVTPGELALIKTIFTIFLTFSLCMTPYMISTLVDSKDKWPPIAHIVCSFTAFTNSCLNCVIYGLMTPAFKKVYLNIIPCLKHHHDPHHDHHHELHHDSSHHHHHNHHPGNSNHTASTKHH